MYAVVGVGEEEGEIGKGRGGEGRQYGDILTFTNGITDENILSVIPSVIMPMKGHVTV